MGSQRTSTFLLVLWLKPVILTTHRRQVSGGSWFEVSLGKQFVRPYLEKPLPKTGLI
jgi:hypothetical protein